MEGRCVSVMQDSSMKCRTLTFCALVVLCFTSSTLETRYIWKFYSVYNLFCFVAYKTFDHFTMLAGLLTRCPDFWLMKLRSRNDLVGKIFKNEKKKFMYLIFFKHFFVYLVFLTYLKWRKNIYTSAFEFQKILF